MNRICYLLIIGLCLGCFGADIDLGNTLTGEAVEIIGHGGSGFESVDNYFPTNSQKSILQAVDILGADGVEIDVQMSQDSVLFLYHDNYLTSQTNCQNCLWDHPAEEILACRYRSNIAAKFDPSATLWTFESLLADFGSRPDPPRINVDVSIPVDCQSDLDTEAYFRTLARQLFRLLEAYQARDWVYLEFAQLWQLEYMQYLAPDYDLVWLGTVDRERLQLAAERKYWGVVTENELINKSLVEEAHSLGLGVIVYNVKIRQSAIEAIEKGVDLIETDNIPLCHSVMEQKNK